MNEKPKTNPFYYVTMAVIAVAVVVVVFVKNFRQGEKAGSAAPRPAGEVTQVAAVDLRELARKEDLALRGKTLFQINCASCHGPKGYGDGDRAASLNPKPRNYHTDKFKFGDDIVSVYNTLQKGSPGTSMPSFALLPPEDVMAMAHYVRTLIPNPPPTTDAIIAKLPASKVAATATNIAAMMDSLFKDTGPRIPIQLAMQVLAQTPANPRYASRLSSDLPGAAIYSQRCASCHGQFGEGKTLRALSIAPYRYETTVSLAGSPADWTKSQQKFSELVLRGFPGHSMPGNGTLTPQQMSELYHYVRRLAQ